MTVRIGTRGSPLALVQAAEVRRRLRAVEPDLPVEIRVIKTSGDRIQNRPLMEVGGKGLFTKEIEEALAEGSVDLAVHSMKDMPTWLPDGLGIAAMLPREDPRDALIGAPGLDALASGARIGTSSLRRQALLLHHRPDLSVLGLRGNVETRLKKLGSGTIDATLLAVAGLKRLGLAHLAAAPLDPSVMLPAVAQGAIGIEIRLADAATAARVAALDDAPTHAAVRAERAMLATLDGSCHTPIAGLAVIDGAEMRLDGMIAKPDGSAAERVALDGPAGDPEALGRAVGEALLGRAGTDFLSRAS